MYIAIAACTEYPHLTPDEAPTLAALAQLGIEAIPRVWNDPDVDWTACDWVIIRNTWDYFTMPEVFFAWLDRLESLGVRVLNPLPIVRWNSNKSYLNDLKARGYPVVPTIFCSDLPSALENIGRLSWPQIIKPAVSGGAYKTHLVHNFDDYRSVVENYFKPSGENHSQYQLLIQPYVSAIERCGEWSLMYTGGAFSHAVHKLPKRGDFRVHEEHGGSTTAKPAPAAARALADRLIGKEASDCVYARVDLVEADGAFTLMELELVEPSLYFQGNQAAIEQYAKAIAKQIN
jgi:glutathione synthase/RimK-type ligase-like ATP-grasp enzyme